MSVTKDEVRHIAHLARLRVSEDRLDTLASELNGILDWIEQLDEVDVEGVEAMTTAVESSLPMREDKVTAAGDRDRDPLRHDDVTFSHSSRGTYAAGMLVFAAVIGDAALIAEVIDVDTHGRDPRAVPGAPAPPRADAGAFSSSLPPTQREIEGAGGEMWYEARHIGAGRAA